MRFLIAEDDRIWRRLEQSIVDAAGYQHVTAESWPKVISLLRENRFERMILDLSLASNSESGIEALQFITQLTPPDALVICTHYTNKLLRDCYSLPFVKNVIPKSRISDHFDEIVRFLDQRITHDRLQSIIMADLIGGVSKMGSGVDVSTARDGQRTVFVVHGRDSVARDAMFALLRALGLNPLEWSEAIRMVGKGAPFIGDVLDAAFQRAAAVIVLLTGDDEARLLRKYVVRDDPTYERRLTSQPRPNVLFEAGLAFGKNPDRTILVQFADVRPFSDIAGRHILRFRGTVGDRNELATRLETAKCAIKREGKDWLTAGNFEKVLEPVKSPSRKRRA